MQDMVYHTQCVARGNNNAFLLADMPFMSYATVNDALA
jgi:3-methyl-2-oxobutanoate hydroxymethyltransferase